MEKHSGLENLRLFGGLLLQLFLELVLAERGSAGQVCVAGLLQQFIAGDVVRLVAEVFFAAGGEGLAELFPAFRAEVRAHARENLGLFLLDVVGDSVPR
jgi:hypothetical protein